MPMLIEVVMNKMDPAKPTAAANSSMPQHGDENHIDQVDQKQR
jgi:hypothetical protein